MNGNNIEKIDDIIEKFKATGRYSKEITFSPEDMDAWEKEIGVKFPPDYRKAQSSGSYYKANFRFMKPEKMSTDPGMVLFAYWNDARFAFKTDEGKNGDFPVYILVGEFVEKRFENFREWFAMVFDNASQPFNSE